MYLFVFLAWRFDACLALLLKRVEHVNDAFELHRVDGPIRAPAFVFNHFKHTGSAKSFQGFCIRMLFAGLGVKESLPKRQTNRPRELAYILSARTHPVHRLGLRLLSFISRCHSGLCLI